MKEKEFCDLLKYERELTSKGYKRICGIDEAGRGPLAGPVVVAAVIMDLDEDKIIRGVNDSKKLSEKKREELYKEIILTAKEYTVAVVDEVVIDDINILEATKLGMQDCVERLKYVDFALIDAVKLDLVVEKQALIHGDALSYSIAAASIVAKVTRDNIMREFAKLYPQYGFEKHKGYGTKAHIEALKEYGACPIHRRSFIKNFIKV